MQNARLPKGFRTAFYVASVAIINWLFVVVPMWPVLGTVFPPVMLIVGFVFVLRDFAQREVGHYVLVAMLAAAAISYFISSPAVALASFSAFLVSECVDWAVFSLTGRPLAQRVLWSSAISVPVDTALFLALVGILDVTSFVLVTAAKMVGAILVWLWLRFRTDSDALAAKGV